MKVTPKNQSVRLIFLIPLVEITQKSRKLISSNLARKEKGLYTSGGKKEPHNERRLG